MQFILHFTSEQLEELHDALQYADEISAKTTLDLDQLIELTDVRNNIINIFFDAMFPHRQNEQKAKDMAEQLKRGNQYQLQQIKSLL